MIRTHFEHAPAALRTMVRALGLGLPADATPLARLRVILRWLAEQSIFETHIAAVVVWRRRLWLRLSGLLRLGLGYRSRVTHDAGDERAEREEGEGVYDEQVRNEVAGRVEGQVVVVEEDVHDRRMWR